jgi:hypothetical protein
MIAMLGLAAAPIFLILLCMLIFIPVGVALLAFWIWMLVSAVQNRGLSEGEKIAWVLVIVFLHALGALLYLFIGHPKRNMPLSPSS